MGSKWHRCSKPPTAANACQSRYTSSIPKENFSRRLNHWSGEVAVSSSAWSRQKWFVHHETVLRFFLPATLLSWPAHELGVHSRPEAVVQIRRGSYMEFSLVLGFGSLTPGSRVRVSDVTFSHWQLGVEEKHCRIRMSRLNDATGWIKVDRAKELSYDRRFVAYCVTKMADCEQLNTFKSTC